MLMHPTIEKLNALKLRGMSQALQIQMSTPECQKLGFEERIGLLVDHEATERENTRLKRLLKTAKLRRDACMQDIDYRQSRCLDKSLMMSLETCKWISCKKSVLINGATGTGKTFLAEALAHNACTKGYSAYSLRIPKFFNELALSRADGSYLKRMALLAKFDVLVLDDFGIISLTAEQRGDLLEIIEERHGRKSTIITSQLPITAWYEVVGDATIADAILDRLIHNAYRIELKGDSMRKILSQKDDNKEHKKKEVI